MLSRSGFTEKSVEGIVSASYGLVTWHLAIRLDSMLQAVQLPTRITNLHSCLADMNWDTLTLCKKSFSCQRNLQTLAKPGQNLQFTYRNLKFLTPLHLEEKRLYLILTHSLNHETKKNHWKNSISVKSKQFKLRKHIKLACICSSKISYPGRSVIILFSS